MSFCFQASGCIDRHLALDQSSSFFDHFSTLTLGTEPQIFVRNYFIDRERIMDLDQIHVPDSETAHLKSLPDGKSCGYKACYFFPVKEVRVACFSSTNHLHRQISELRGGTGITKDNSTRSIANRRAI